MVPALSAESLHFPLSGERIVFMSGPASASFVSSINLITRPDKLEDRL
jgi:hypothetical protein